MPKARRVSGRSRYLVIHDYATTDLLGTTDDDGVPQWDGKGGVSWAADAVIEIDRSDATWVNRHRPGTLVEVVLNEDGAPVQVSTLGEG